MVSSRRQLSPCPACSRVDQVKKLQTAYNTGELRFAPPSMPESHASMMKYMVAGMVLVGVGAILVFIILSSGEFSWPQLIITLLFIVAALVLSFLAIQHIGQGDEEARRRYPVWDEAMANWNRLLFCSRDKVIFDPATKKVLTDSAVTSLLSMDELDSQQRLQTQIVASH
ncbi:MAG TPA: hypothetical protein VFN35_18105 [Ktedonobacteraceae bacterium]|nr:hypothetical protein [Ktedonobacteraceae bacterium]